MKSLNDAGRVFRDFFDELREAFLERETLLAQIELALLCREHVLVTGPPGTAKSAVASAVLARITDEATGKPSLFAKQISELTVQTDLIGAVDFKVLTETGRTEYLTEEGMLGATHAFLDEVFDGRDMLLRSILNVLHERELKHGRKVTPGRTECVIMTSNRYLSEVLARSPELLLAFADRLSFICFVPKAFARPHSRASMLQRANLRQKMELRCQLTLGDLDVLQHAVESVQVSSVLVEAIENLADKLEKELLKQVSKMQDYVPTKYFSHRSVVKALWALKAAVVRDRIYQHPDRALAATPRDLDVLRYFFLLGGPAQNEIDALLRAAVDPRERAQLEILRLEHQAFDVALSQVLADTTGGVTREAQHLRAADDFAQAEAQVRNYQSASVLALAQSLKDKLIPGPRHPDNRNAVLAAARMLVTAVQSRLSHGMAGQGEGRGGTQLHASLRAGLELVKSVPELSARMAPLAQIAAGFCEQALEMIALSAEGVEFEGALKVEQLSALAQNLDEEIDGVRELASFLAVADAEGTARLSAIEADVRARAASSLRRRAERAFSAHKLQKGANLDETLVTAGNRLRELEEALVALSPSMKGIKQELLSPIAREYAREVLGVSEFTRTEQFAHLVRKVAERIRQEGLAAESILAECRDLIEARLARHAGALKLPPAPMPLSANAAASGDAYVRYRQGFANAPPDGELRGLIELESALGGEVPNGSAQLLSMETKQAVARAELAVLQMRIDFLKGWTAELLKALPDPNTLSQRPEAERAFDQLVKSRLPLLAMKEGELVRLAAALSPLSAVDGEVGEGARRLETTVKALAEEFGGWSKRLLDVRARL